MSAIDFPASPTANQIFSAPSGIIYRWQATPGMWLAVGQSSPGGDFCATNSASVAIPTSNTTMVLPTIRSGNSGSWYNTTTGRYTPPAGRYFLSAVLTTVTAGTGAAVQVQLLKNGSVIALSLDFAAATSWTSCTADGTFDANGTDYFEMQAGTNSSAGVTSGASGSVSFTAYPISGIQGPPGDPGTPLAQNAQTGSYTLVLGDANGHLYHAVAAATATYTIPANASVAYPIGTTLTFVNDSVNNVTIAITTDTMVLSPGTTTGSRTLATGGVATALKVTSTRWLINGTGLT